MHKDIIVTKKRQNGKIEKTFLITYNYRLFQAVNAANQLQQDRINNNNITPATTTPSLNILEHRIYTIAPIWKRVVAEMIDFVILLVLKE